MRAFILRTDTLETHVNPYSPPNGYNGPVVSSFRWRVLPSLLIGLIGATSFGIGTYGVAIVLHILITEGHISFDAEYIAVLILYLGFGAFWIASGAFVWKTNYRYAIMSALIGFAILVLVSLFGL